MTNVIRGRVVMLARLLSTFVLAGTSATALANVGEIDLPFPFPYIGLGDAGTPMSSVAGVIGGLGDIQLKGWTFPFAKTTFSEVMVAQNGFLTVGSGKQVCGCTASLGSDTTCNASNDPEDPYEGPFSEGAACDIYPPEVGVFNQNIENYIFQPEFSPGLIAPFYAFDDNYFEALEDPEYESVAPVGTVSYLQGGSSGNHYLIVDWDNGNQDGYPEDFPPLSGNFTHQFQAILFESGAIVFTYGNQSPVEIQSSNGNQVDEQFEFIAGAYYPPPDGGMGITDAGTWFAQSQLLTTGCMDYWELYGEFCEDSSYENEWNQLIPIYIGELDAPLLSSAPTATAQPGMGGPAINVSVTVTNSGSSAQSMNFPIDYYLIKEGSPPYGLPSDCTPENFCFPGTFAGPIGAGHSVSQGPQVLQLGTPLPPSGLYNVASVIDPLNTTVMATAPLLEIGVSTTSLVLGQDMTGQIEVTDFTAVEPGTFIVPLVFQNLGLEEAISVPYEIFFVNSAGIKTGTTPSTVYGVAGLSNQVVNEKVTVPTNPPLPAGEYQLELDIDAGLPADLRLGNNTILGIQHVENGQDLTATILSVPFALASPVATPTDFTVPVTWHNLGLQPANGIPWTLFLTGADGIPRPVGSSYVTVQGLTFATAGLSGVITNALPSGTYTLSLSIGFTTGQPNVTPLTPDLNQANNNIISTTPVYVYSGAVDYAVGSGDLVLDGSGHAADGQIISVTRTIHNLEGPAGACPYSYFLNPPSVTQIGDGVPVAILGPTGPVYLGTTPTFGPYGEASANDTATDKLVIPAGMPVGAYNLVLAINPENQVDDINPLNNITSVALTLAPNPLQIKSPSSLPAAVIDTPYVYDLQQAGASGEFAWSILAGSLPTGLALDNSSGEISGSPTQTGVSTIVVQLTAEGGTQVAVLQLPVASGSGALQIEQSGLSLPTAIVMSSYLQQLEAQGGVPPYTWTGTIPSSLDKVSISSDGVLGGIPLAATNGPVQFTVIVTDAIGTTASATLTVEVIAPGALTITTPFMQPAVVGVQYDQPILASDGTVTGASFNWSLSTQTTLPTGLLFQEIGKPAVADISGVPTQAGIFPVVVNLVDNFGHSASRQYILNVAESPIPVPKQTLPPAIVGNSYAAQLLATSVSTLTWRVFSGQLPAGLSLAPTGAISGTVPSNTTTGIYPFSAAVSNADGAESVVALDIQVQLPAASSGGCATGTGPAGAGLLLLAMAWLSRRRRRLPGSVVAAVGAVLLSAPALSQVPVPPCGAPPKAIVGAIPFQDITTALGYQSLAQPLTASNPSNPLATDVYSDWVGSTGSNECGSFECYSDEAQSEYNGPYQQAINLGAITLPFPFGFSGIYSDGGISAAPFQVTVWANGLLTFDPSVSFNPFAFPLNPVPSDCQFNEECAGSCETIPAPLPSGAVSDTFGGFPFTGQYAPPTIPDALIAPWWGDLSLCPDIGQVGWLSTLDDNNLPMVVIQWTKASATPPEATPSSNNCQIICECTFYDYSSCTRYSNNEWQLTGPGVLPTFTFQVRLHSNNDVDFVYGPSSNFNPANNCYANAVGNCNYVSGIQSTLVYPNNAAEPPIASYSVEGVNCDPTAGCPQSQFPASGTSVTFADVFRPLGPDIQLTAMNPPRLLTQGGTATIPLTLSNAGGAPSHEGQVQFYFSAGGTTPEGGAFGLQNVPSYVSCQTVPFPAQVTVPTSVPQGGGYLIAELIPGPESVDGTHTFASSPVIIGPPEPDLAVEGGLGVTPVSVVGGQDITINFVAANVGEVDAPPTAYGIYVSLGGSISATGNQIFGGVLPALASGATIPITQSIQVPVSLVSGEYLIGVIVNPANTLDEVNLSNNIGLGKKLLNVTSPGPVITTTSLADARANAPYSIQLVAGGGDGIYQWSLLAGALPGGLALTRAGLINGQAEAVGSSTFTVKVTDGVGHNASAVFSLNVDPFEQVLTIETVDLPAGSTGQPYKFTIAAVGGAPPYQWALVSGAGSLPSGISLVSDGTLTGEPQYDGTSTFQVNVTDSNGQVVTSPAYALTVYAAGSLAVGSTQLGTAILNETYSGTLHYAGGTPPYTWSLISVDREPGYPGDPGQAFGPSLPAGLTFYGAQGQVEGTPAQVGVFALTVQVTDGEVPVPATAQGLVLLTVTSTTSFSFETVQLPPAVINQPYSTNLLTSPPSTPLPANYAVTFNVINSAQLVTLNAIRTVPVGITVDPDGTVAGVPVQVGTFSFLVEATDTEGGVAEQSFTLQVTSAKPASSGGGCQSAPGAPALAGLVLLALTGVRRRSARRRT